MENLKRKSVKAYLLLESLISIALLAFLVSFIVSSLVQVRQKDTEENQKIEALNVAQMAIESHLTELSINGSDIKIKEIINKTRRDSSKVNALVIKISFFIFVLIIVIIVSRNLFLSNHPSAEQFWQTRLLIIMI